MEHTILQSKMGNMFQQMVKHINLQMAEQLDIAKSVTWMGRLPQTKLPALFQTTSCLCVPSIVAKDGGRRLAITFDIRYKAQAFALILKEELTKRKIAGTVRRVNRYQVDVA